MPIPLPKLTPKFEGTRFLNHAIPVEMLGDLAAYRDLVRDVAKELYKRADSDRKRVPPIFNSVFALSLTGIEEGSAIPVLESTIIADAETETQLAQIIPFFDAAKKLIDDTVRNAAAGGDFVQGGFPEKLLTNFGKIGKFLLPGEILNFGHGSDQPANYTASVRETLVLWASGSVEGVLDVLGTVMGITEVSENVIVLRQLDGKIVSGPYDSALEEDLTKAFRLRETHRVRIKGSGIFDSKNVLLKISEATEVEILTERDVEILSAEGRITAMTKLPLGWCDGIGEPLSESAAGWMKGVLVDVLEESETPIPYIFPTPTAGVQWEWKLTSGGIDVRFNPVSRECDFFAYWDDGEMDQSIDFNRPEAPALFRSLVMEIRTLSDFV